jgi:hypothetical protein
MDFGFIEMGQKTLLELLVGCLFRHFRKRLHELLLGIIDVLQLVHEQVVHGSDVFGKESHCADPFVWGTHSDAFVVAAAPICSIADATLTDGSRGCSSRLRKRRAMEQEHREKWNGRTAAARDWNFGRCDICTACDTRPSIQG